MSYKSSPPPSQHPGDILLLNGTVKRSRLNRAAQGLVTFNRSRFSHVAMCLGTGKFIHADPDGVSFIFIDDLLKKYPGEWTAIRHPNLPRTEQDTFAKIYLAACYYQGMPYVKSIADFYKSRCPIGHTFCSLLVSDILDDLGYGITARAGAPYPIHFQKQIDTRSWDDVTLEHRAAISGILKSPEIKELALESFSNSSKMKQQIKETVELYRLVNSFMEMNHKISSIIEDSKSDYQPLPYMIPVFEYWDVQQPSGTSAYEGGSL